MLINAGMNQGMNSYSIQADQMPIEIAADKDLFIGPNVHITLIIPNGQTIQVRDILVLGKLSIQSSNMEDASIASSLVARNIFIPGNGNVSLSNVNLTYDKCSQCASKI
jgi:hypothetical protein